MSSITATPSPNFGRAPLVIGIAVVGIAAAAVVVPRLHSVTATVAPVAVAPAEAPESLGRRDAAAAAAAAAAAGPAHLADLTHLAAHHGISAQTLREQVGGFAPTFPYTPAIGAGLTSVAREQIGGAHLTYVYNGSGMVPELAATGSGAATHTTWSDNFVPPYDDPIWAPYIQKHFFGPFPVPSTHSAH